MIQTEVFWQRPYWQRLLIGAFLFPVVILIMFAEAIKALIVSFATTLWELGRDLVQHVAKLYRFYRYDVLSPNPAKHLPKPNANYWDAQ